MTVGGLGDDQTAGCIVIEIGLVRIGEGAVVHLHRCLKLALEVVGHVHHDVGGVLAVSDTGDPIAFSGLNLGDGVVVLAGLRKGVTAKVEGNLLPRLRAGIRGHVHLGLLSAGFIVAISLHNKVEGVALAPIAALKHLVKVKVVLRAVHLNRQRGIRIRKAEGSSVLAVGAAIRANGLRSRAGGVLGDSRDRPHGTVCVVDNLDIDLVGGHVIRHAAELFPRAARS